MSNVVKLQILECKKMVKESNSVWNYDKKHLNERYLENKEKNAILNVISVIKNIILDS